MEKKSRGCRRGGGVSENFTASPLPTPREGPGRAISGSIRPVPRGGADAELLEQGVQGGAGDREGLGGAGDVVVMEGQGQLDVEPLRIGGNVGTRGSTRNYDYNPD